jgi:hypothetical protein
MTVSRRDFLSATSSAGLFTLLASQLNLADAAAEVAGTSPQAKTAGEKYWDTLYLSESQRSRGGQATPNEERDPRFVHYSESTGIRWVEDIKANELPTFTEDAVVTMEISGFRPGKLDTSKLAKAQFGQLHLSLQQVAGSEFVGPLVWAAIATVFADKASKLPAIKDLDFSQSQNGQTLPGAPSLNRVLLKQGSGHMSVNITTTPRTSLLDNILSYTMQAAKIMTPLLGFPAISLPALQAFYSFYGTLEKSSPSNFLLNSSRKDVAATQEGADNSLISVNALKLIAGNYFLVPKAQEADFQKEMKDLTAQGGYLVNSSDKSAPDQRVANAIPTVTYASLNVRVQALSAYTAQAAKASSTDDQPQANSSETDSNSKKTTKKPGGKPN